MQRKLFAGVVVCGLMLVMLAAGLTSAPSYGGAGPRDEEGRYRVMAGQSSYILYDSISGVSWILYIDAKDRRPAFVPIKRLTSAAEIEAHKLQE